MSYAAKKSAIKTMGDLIDDYLPILIGN